MPGRPPPLRAMPLGTAVAKFPRHLHHQISAHRISRKENRVKSIASRQFFKHRSVIPAHSGVIKCRGQLFRATAISLIQPNDVKTPPPSLLRNPKHVVRIARPFQAMHQHQHRRLPDLCRLPVALAQKPRVGIHLKMTALPQSAAQNRRTQNATPRSSHGRSLAVDEDETAFGLPRAWFQFMRAGRSEQVDAIGSHRSIVNTLSVRRVYLRAGFRIEWFRESGGNLRASVFRDDGLAGGE